MWVGRSRLSGESSTSHGMLANKIVSWRVLSCQHEDDVGCDMWLKCHVGQRTSVPAVRDAVAFLFRLCGLARKVLFSVSGFINTIRIGGPPAFNARLQDVTRVVRESGQEAQQNRGSSAMLTFREGSVAGSLACLYSTHTSRTPFDGSMWGRGERKPLVDARTARSQSS